MKTDTQIGETNKVCYSCKPGGTGIGVILCREHAEALELLEICKEISEYWSVMDIIPVPLRNRLINSISRAEGGAK